LIIEFFSTDEGREWEKMKEKGEKYILLRWIKNLVKTLVFIDKGFERNLK
jgi:hypothetical protein